MQKSIITAPKRGKYQTKKIKRTRNKKKALCNIYTIIEYDLRNKRTTFLNEIFDKDDAHERAKTNNENADTGIRQVPLPVHEPGTFIIPMFKFVSKPCFSGKTYYPIVRALYSDTVQYQAVALIENKEGAIKLAKYSEQLEDPNLVYTYIDSPIQT
jgi:hypothetical protein